MAPATTKNKIKAAPAPKKIPAVVYVGPNLAGDLQVSQFTVFRNGLPHPMQELIKQDKTIQELLVPVADLAKARIDLARPGSRLAKLSGEVLENLKQRRAN